MKVRITAVEKVRHSEIIELSDEAWKKYQSMIDRNAKDSEFTKEFESYMKGDNLDSDGLTDLEIEKIA